HRLDEKLITTRGETRRIQLPLSGIAGQFSQLRKPFANLRSIAVEVVHSGLVPCYFPGQIAIGNRWLNLYAIINARFKFRPFFVIVPGHNLQIIKRPGRREVAVHSGERVQPDLSAFLVGDTILAPRCDSVVEFFVYAAEDHRTSLALRSQNLFVEFIQVRHVAFSRVVDPGKSPVALRLPEGALIAKYE